MDLATLVGIVLGLVMVVFGIISSADISAITKSFLDLPSFIITFGGSIAGMIGSYTFKELITCLKGITIAFKDPKLDYGGLIGKIIELSNVARKEGLLALEEVAGNLDDEFMKKGILLIVDGTDPDLVKGIMETELSCMEERHAKVSGFWDTWASMGPAWGMIGTLIGLINMLQFMNDPTMIGPKMAVALVTTFYGSVIANWLATPTSNKLKQNNEQEVQLKSIMIEGLLSIQAGENPRVIEEKLKSFLAPGSRELMNDSEGGE